MARKKANPRPEKVRATGGRRSLTPQPAAAPQTQEPFPIVGVGASAGGLGALTALLKALPEHSGLGFVLIQHLDPQHESALTQILSKTTPMEVVEATDGMAVKPNHVYVIPPNKSMTIRGGALKLAPRPSTPAPHHPIDEFCAALAKEYRSAAIGVILSGSGADGTLGLKTIKTNGGVTFAQDPKTAEWPSMPLSAIASGAIDFVLPPRRIALELARIGHHPYLREHGEEPAGDGLDRILLVLRSATGVDFRMYKQHTVRRRVARRMALRRIGSAGKYAQLLKQVPAEAEALAEDIFIHVTGFFRDPECLQALRRFFPRLPAKRPADAIRIWVPGCSTGEEAYSIAILLLEDLGPQAAAAKIQIFGTDVSEPSVERARAGIYSEAAVRDVSRARLKRFFVKADHGYQINKMVRELCVFARHDLAKDPPFSRLNLVSCRNVLIYMGPALQKKVMSIFHYALKPGGILFLGKSEAISAYTDLFAAEDHGHKIFSRKTGLGAAPPRFEWLAGGYKEHRPDAPKSVLPVPAADVQREAEQVLLRHYSPPGLVVDSDLRIVHFQGDTGRYLALATGPPTFHLLKMVRPEFVVELRDAVSRARKQGTTAETDAIAYAHNGLAGSVCLEVSPLRRPATQKRDFLVVFREAPPRAAPPAKPAGKGGQGKTVQRLERELASMREHLRSLIAEHEAAQEEMKAASPHFSRVVVSAIPRRV